MIKIKRELNTHFKNNIPKFIIAILGALLLGIVVYLAVNILDDIYPKRRWVVPIEGQSALIGEEQEDGQVQFPATTYVNIDEVTGIMEYGSPTMLVTIEPVAKENPKLTMWISTIKVKFAEQIKSAFAGDEFSLKNREKTSDMAARHGAIFAVNGAAYGFNERSFVIRDGILYRATDLDCAPLIIKDNGDFAIFNYGEKTGEEILAMGGIHTYDFGPDLIKNGEIVDYGDGWYKEGKDPRTAIGQLGPLEYVVIVADGRSEKSEGISFYDLALEFQRLGCQWAYALDGGGSTTLYFNGKVINEPSDWNGERAVTDIIYFSN